MTLLVELYVLLATSIISNIILFIALAVTMKRSEKKELEIVKYWKKIWREAKDSSDFWQMIYHAGEENRTVWENLFQKEKLERIQAQTEIKLLKGHIASLELAPRPRAILPWVPIIKKGNGQPN